jgi:putative endonuclease
LNGKREHTRRTAGRRAAQQRGARAEQRAALYLRLKGYRILARGYRTPVGEIDLLAAVEVKSRGDRDTAAFSISPRQQARVARATEHYLAANPRYAAYRIRFDAILDTPWRLPKHIRDAWRIT